MRRAQREGMTLLEVVIVVVIIALAGAGLSFSLGALTKTNLRAGAGKVAAAARYAYHRAIVKGTTVRISFDVPGSTFSIEEANRRVTLARIDDERRQPEGDESDEIVAADPWAAARTRVEEALTPSLGGSPFKPISTSDGSKLDRYQNVSLGRRVQIVRLIVPHYPAPLEQGKGAVHFFSGGMTEHAVVHLGDGGDSVYSVEIFPLTGRTQIRPEAYEPRELLGDPDHPDVSEVDL